jgi:hypothetical protein
MNPADPLPDAQHERFACELAKGASSQAAAYETAFGKRDRTQACKLAAKHSIKQRVLWLKKQSAVSDVLDLAEKRRIAAQIARGGLKDADRLNAIKVDNDLAGEGSEAKGMGALAALLGRVRK